MAEASRGPIRLIILTLEWSAMAASAAAPDRACEETLLRSFGALAISLSNSSRAIRDADAMRRTVLVKIINHHDVFYI
jgi:hypothetical protein